MSDAVSEAARGELPRWACASPARREHMARVAALLEAWAVGLGLPPEERGRWRAAGYLHDALRDEAPELLRPRLPPVHRDLPDALLHGPVAAERLRTGGVRDGALLRAVAFHTVGDASFCTLGRALYAADFLEPGRGFLVEWRAELRTRMPHGLHDVVYEIARVRIGNLLERGTAILPQTLGFWNTLVAERG